MWVLTSAYRRTATMTRFIQYTRSKTYAYALIQEKTMLLGPAYTPQATATPSLLGALGSGKRDRWIMPPSIMGCKWMHVTSGISPLGLHTNGSMADGKRCFQQTGRDRSNDLCLLHVAPGTGALWVRGRSHPHPPASSRTGNVGYYSPGFSRVTFGE
jgi:hypothetical protein